MAQSALGHPTERGFMGIVHDQMIKNCTILQKPLQMLTNNSVLYL